ncbi:MAG: LytR/AlgR family response regulator transcription factor [Chitinophagaceae bacterium]
MNEKVRILIVEDDMIIAANISLQLTNLGYEVMSIIPRGEEAIAYVKENKPDILLMDIKLKGTLDGIDTARAIQQHTNIPVIYLTANNEESTFNKAKETHPLAFISKPLNALELRRAVALVVEQLKEKSEVKQINETQIEVLEDRIFVRDGGKMIKILLDDILFVEAERNYCNIVTAPRNYLIATTLKTMEEKLPVTFFVRVHRSYMINISKLDTVADSHLEIGRKSIPLSKSYRELLLSRIQMI